MMQKWLDLLKRSPRKICEIIFIDSLECLMFELGNSTITPETNPGRWKNAWKTWKMLGFTWQDMENFAISPAKQ